jgi:hypothetical protein
LVVVSQTYRARLRHLIFQQAGDAIDDAECPGLRVVDLKPDPATVRDENLLTDLS